VKIPTNAVLEELVLTVLKHSEKGLSSREIDQKVIEISDIDPDELLKIHSGNRTVIAYRLAWARTALKRKNLIKLESNTWSIAV
jgi:restriction system protein